MNTLEAAADYASTRLLQLKTDEKALKISDDVGEVFDKYVALVDHLIGEIRIACKNKKRNSRNRSKRNR